MLVGNIMELESIFPVVKADSAAMVDMLTAESTIGADLGIGFLEVAAESAWQGLNGEADPVAIMFSNHDVLRGSFARFLF